VQQPGVKHTSHIIPQPFGQDVVSPSGMSRRQAIQLTVIAGGSGIGATSTTGLGSTLKLSLLIASDSFGAGFFATFFFTFFFAIAFISKHFIFCVCYHYSFSKNTALISVRL
jgi:hypothetical protein